MSIVNNVEQQVIEVIAETAKIDKAKVTPDSSFINDLKLDSLSMVEIMMALEAKFKIEIPDEEAGKIQTVKDAVNYIETEQQKLKVS